MLQAGSHQILGAGQHRHRAAAASSRHTSTLVQPRSTPGISSCFSRRQWHVRPAAPSACLQQSRPTRTCVHARGIPTLHLKHQKPRTATRAAAYRGSRGGEGLSKWNPVEVVKREQGLQSNKVPTQVRERVSSAVEELTFRVTSGDVAARAGVKLSEAEGALQALAYDTAAALEVSEQGDVVYSFTRDFRSKLAQRSLLLRAAPAWRTAQRVAEYLVRVAFGTTLVASVAIVWLAVAVLLSSSQRDDRRDDRGGGYYSSYHSGPRLYINIIDMFTYLDPNWGYNRRNNAAPQNIESMNFLEAVFSFVFGDGDPNASFEARRAAALGKMIQDRGGVVTAEEMAPYLDPPEPEASSTRQPAAAGRMGAYSDESFVLPALLRFGGEPFVDETTGALLYRFPALQTTAGTTKEEAARGARLHNIASAVSGFFGAQEPARGNNGSGGEEVPQEEPWSFSGASAGQLLGVVGLGVFNLVGILTLSGLLSDPRAYYTLAYQGLGWITSLMPWLQVYAAAFFLIPAVRWALLNTRNSAIEARNSTRLQAAQMLNSGVRWLREKLGIARREGQRRTIKQSDVVFSSAKDATQQINESDMSEWDRRMQQLESQQQEDSSSRRSAVPGQQQQARSVHRERVRDYDGSW